MKKRVFSTAVVSLTLCMVASTHAATAAYAPKPPVVPLREELIAAQRSYLDRSAALFDEATGTFRSPSGEGWQPDVLSAMALDESGAYDAIVSRAVEAHVPQATDSLLASAKTARLAAILTQKGKDHANLSLAFAALEERLSTQRASFDEPVAASDTASGSEVLTAVRPESTAAAIEALLASDDPEHIAMANRALVFAMVNLVNRDGAVSFLRSDGLQGERGFLRDSAPLLLAVTQAHAVTGDPYQFTGSIRLANFALDQTYDWKSGVFLDANPENADLEDATVWRVSPRENAMMSAGLMRLYRVSRDERYLAAAVKSLGSAMERFAPLDEGYPLHEAIGEALAINAIAEFDERKIDIQAAEQEGLRKFVLSHPKTGVIFTSSSAVEEEGSSQNLPMTIVGIGLIGGLLWLKFRLR